MNPTQLIEHQLALLGNFENKEGTTTFMQTVLQSSLIDPTATMKTNPPRPVPPGFGGVSIDRYDASVSLKNESTGEMLYVPNNKKSLGNLRLAERLAEGSPILDEHGYGPNHEGIQVGDQLIRWEQIAKTVTHSMKGAIRSAYAYRVSADMCNLVGYAAAKFSGEELFEADMAPTDYGLVFFEKPMTIRDPRGKIMLGHWLVWQKTSRLDTNAPAFYLHWFNDIVIQPDEVVLEAIESIPSTLDKMLQQIGRYAYVGTDVAGCDQPVGTLYSSVSESARLTYLTHGIKVYERTNTAALVYALWSLLNQTVTSVEEGQVKKSKKAQIRRARIPGRVTVVALRRIENFSRANGESMVDWQHRWMVRGHWRNQRFGTGRSEVKRIWINPFWKGPEDAPIKQSEKVYDLKR